MAVGVAAQRPLGLAALAALRSDIGWGDVGVGGLQVLRCRAARIDSARATLACRGGPAVFLGRFVAFLRAVTPFLARRRRPGRFAPASCLVLPN